MKTLLLFLLLTQFTYAQSTKICLHVQVETVEACEKAEPCIEKLCNFVLTQPFKSQEEELQIATKKVLDWMNVTMNYGFTVDDEMMPIFMGPNRMLFGHYMVCMAKGAFVDKPHQDYEGLKLFVAYIENPENRVIKDKPVRQLLRDWKRKKIKQYLNRGDIPKKK